MGQHGDRRGILFARAAGFEPRGRQIVVIIVAMKGSRLENGEVVRDKASEVRHLVCPRPTPRTVQGYHRKRTLGWRNPFVLRHDQVVRKPYSRVHLAGSSSRTWKRQ
jgi:hypothetical protein